MSNLSGDDRTAQQESTQQKQKGPEAFLTNEERKDLQRSLSYPEDLPPKFKNWIQEYIAVNIPQIPISNIVGFQIFKDQLAAQDAAIAAAAVTVSSTANEATITAGGALNDPQLTALQSGTYIFHFGCLAGISGSGTDSINADLAFAGVADTASRIQNGFGPATSISRAYKKVLSTATDVSMHYGQSGGSSPSWSARWIVALRTGAA